MAQKYYNSEDAAKLFGVSVDEIRKMIDRRELHGYRDGADWKFKAEDIDQMVQQRQAEGDPAAPAAEEGGDVLLSEATLGQAGMGTSGTVIAMEGVGEGIPESDIQLAGSDINIVDQSPTPPVIKKPEADRKAAPFEELNLTLDDDSAVEDSAATLRSMPVPGVGGSAIDLGGKGLEDDDLVLGGSGTGSDASIGADSGISLVDPGDSGLSLEQPLELAGTSGDALHLGEDVTPAGIAPRTSSDSDFLLTPLEDVGDAEGSESGSQVIALDTETEQAGMVGAGAGASMAAMLDEDLSSQPSLDLGMGAATAGAGALGVQPAGLSEGMPMVQPGAVVSEAPYSTWQIVGLATCAVLLMICGMMMYDLLRNMWSWDTSYTINSWLMDKIVGS